MFSFDFCSDKNLKSSASGTSNFLVANDGFFQLFPNRSVRTGVARVVAATPNDLTIRDSGDHQKNFT